MERKELISKLKEGDVSVTFTKKDGTERVMKCTLKEDVVPSVESSKKENVGVVVVWDTEKKSWRSFRMDSITNVV
jgi:hypothetical protein